MLTACSVQPSSDSGSSTSSNSSSVPSFGSEGNSTISGLPYPPATNVPKPAGAPGSLIILNWAGFKAAVSYSFDDGQPSQVQNYSLLQEEGVHLTFYICAGWSNTSANFEFLWSQAVKDGHEIGNHTFHHSHADLSDSGTGGTPFSTQLEEIDSNMQYIIDQLGGSNVVTMASPYGDTQWITYASNRYFLNRGVANGTIAPNNGTDPFRLPVYMASGGETASDLNGHLDSDYINGTWLVFLYHTILPGANWYAPVDTANVTGSMEHAKALGWMWIDTVARVGAYWRAQKVLSAVTPVDTGSNTIWSWALPDHFPAGMYLRISNGGGTVKQGTNVLNWDPHGFYEISMDAGSLTVTP